MNWCRPVDEGRQREMVDYFQHKLKGEYLKKSMHHTLWLPLNQKAKDSI